MSYLFNGTNQLINRTTSVARPFSHCAWVKIVALPGATARFFNVANGGNGHSVGITSGGVLTLFTHASSNSGTGTTLSTDVWYHIGTTAIAETGSSNPFRLYLNGVNDITVTDYGAAGSVTRADWASNQGSSYVNCKIGYTRAWPSLLVAGDFVAERDSATAVYAGSAYDDTLVAGLGGWTSENSPTLDGSDNPTFGGGGTMLFEHPGMNARIKEMVGGLRG